MFGVLDKNLKHSRELKFIDFRPSDDVSAGDMLLVPDVGELRVTSVETQLDDGKPCRKKKEGGTTMNSKTYAPEQVTFAARVSKALAGVPLMRSPADRICSGLWPDAPPARPG